VRLRQVLYNLIGNALKYTEKGSVTLTARAGPARQGRARVFFAVSDTGRGIPADVLPTLFERFASGRDAASASRAHGGAGLGLAICKQVTELMGGRIRAESAPGMGATFHVELVLEVARAASISRASEPEPAPAARGKGLKVLAVDDDPVNLMVLEQMLSGAGHQPFKALSGQAALELAAAQAFDLILMDVHMPDLSGAQVLKALRAQAGPNRATPAIAVTADVSFGAQSQQLAQGFSEQVIKPLRAPELLGAIARTVRAPPKKKAAKRA
jgi:CheY-like chemotaxis protein